MKKLCRFRPLALLFLTAFCCVVQVIAAAELPKQSPPAKASELFNPTNVWSIHLTFKPEQWEAIEPKGGGGGFFGGPPPGAGGRPGGRGEPGGGMFGPAMFVAPAFLKDGDRSHDGNLSEGEFRALGEKWFAAWDKDGAGKLDEDKLRAGLNVSIAPPGFGRPGAGGPGGRGPGMNLQGPEGKRNGLASAAGVEFNYVHADLEFAGQSFKDVAVRYKGNGTFMQSRGSLKRSLKVDLEKYVKGQKLAGITRLNLHNNVTDASWMNEPLAHRLFRDAGVPAPRSSYARVYVTVPGKYEKEYFGLYSLIEDPDKHFASEVLGGKKGALFKPVTQNLFADLGSDWKNYNQTYDPKTALSEQQKSRLIDFCKFVTKADDTEFAAKMGGYLDVNEFANFMAVTVWLANLDSILDMGQNFYVYLNERSDKFQFVPWDLDHSFGQFGLRGTQEQRENLSIEHPWAGENRFLERMFKVESFKNLYLAKLAQFSKTIFKPERFHQQVDEVAATIRPAVQDESSDKLASFNKAVAGEPVAPAGFGNQARGPGERREGRDGPRFGGPGGFMQPAKPIKAFVIVRAQSVSDQLAGKSKGETLGEFGFGGRGGPGGPGGGPGNFLGNAFMRALDANKDGAITHEEFTTGFSKWFESWNTDKSGVLTDDQLRKGINQELSPFAGNRPRDANLDTRPPGQ